MEPRYYCAYCGKVETVHGFAPCEGSTWERLPAAPSVEPTVRLELTPAEAMVVSSALNLKRRMAIRSGVEPTERIDGIATRLRNALADVVQGMRV